MTLGSPNLTPLPPSASTSPTTTQPSTPLSSPGRTAIRVHEVPFRGIQVILSYFAHDRIAIFKQRHNTFVYVIDPSLRQDLRVLTLLEDKYWHYEGDRSIYRVADLAYLMHRLCHETDSPKEQHLEVLATLFRALDDEIDRMSTPSVHIELSIGRELGSGPNEALMYFYWCYIVRYLADDKTILVRIDPEGKISSSGIPKPARILNAKQSGCGFIVCVSWHWGADVVQIWDAEHLNSYGVYFADPRIQHSLLLRGWSTTKLAVTMSRTVGEVIQWRS